ncbi:MAG: (4Fe-4S)-binding protein, partial [Hyphomicrobiales bacterium]
MARRIQEYATDDIVVTFDPNLCVHVANCLRMLPGVFDVGRRKWIDPSAAAPEEIAETIQRCPSGALQYRRLDGGLDEEPDRPTTVRPARNGPLVARGDIRV